MDLEKTIEKAVRCLESHPRVVFAYLFGSMAKDRPTPMSDMDIAVFLDETSDRYDARIDIIGQLNDILRTDDLDVVLLNSAPPALVMNILRSQKILVDKAPFTRHHFESMAYRQYFDFAPREIAMLEKKVLHGRISGKDGKI